MDNNRGQEEPGRAPMVQVPPTSFCVHFSRIDAAFIRRRVKDLGLKGVSAFMQRLLNEARGAKLSVIVDPPEQA